MDILRRAAARTPEAIALIQPGDSNVGSRRVWTYAELDVWVDVVASWLEAVGAGPGRRVAVRLPPSPEAIALLHASARVGSVFVPLHPAWTDVETDLALQAIGPTATYVAGPGDLPDPTTVTPGPTSRQPEGGSSAIGPPIGAGNDPSVLILTSGSTGAPRPIPLSAANLNASARAATERLGLGPEDRWLTSLAMAHVGGLALVHRAAWVGCALLTTPRFEAADTAQWIDSGEVSHLSLVPVMLARLLDERGQRPPPESLRLLLVGGAATPRPLLERSLELGYPIALTYGLTEASSQVATAPPALVRSKPGTVGAPLSGVDLRIHEPDPEGRGEILVRGSPVVRSLEADDGGRRPDGDPAREASSSVRLDEAGWLHTGDLGRVDREGHLWVTGRRSDRIVTGGVTVEPSEVESVLLAHPRVGEVAVIGVPDEQWGERVVAVVVPDPGGPAPLLEELTAFARRRLGAAKRPRGLRVVDRLPRNANGKIDRAALLGD